MDAMNNISPYWCADPRLADARLRQASESFLGVSETDPAIIAGGPDTLLPMPTPIAYDADRHRLAALFRLPLPYLPEGMFQRGVRESVGDWRTRMTITLDMLGAIGFDKDGMPRYGTVDGLPDPKDLTAAAAGFDGGDPTVYDEACDRMRALIGRVWPSGYPLDDMRADAHVIHAHCVRGSLVLSVQTAIALGSAPEGGKAATEILKRVSRTYGPLFNPKGTGPKEVAAWILEHRQWALDMADLLVKAGLEDKSLPDVMGKVLS